MEPVFWIGIGLGFGLSLIASVLANLYNDRIRDDKHIFFIFQAAYTLSFLLSSLTLGIILVVMSRYYRLQGIDYINILTFWQAKTPLNPLIIEAGLFMIFMTFVFALSMWLSLKNLWVYLEYWWRVDNFAHYEKKTEEMWGSDWAGDDSNTRL
jgi:hypothetical protein